MGFLRRLFGAGNETPARSTPEWADVGDGPFDVEKIPGEWHFQITFDDVVAHEEEGRLEAFVRVIDGLPGVDEAVHEDREVILVKARRMSQEELQLEAERAWYAAGRSRPPR